MAVSRLLFTVHLFRASATLTLGREQSRHPKKDARCCAKQVGRVRAQRAGLLPQYLS